MRDIFNILREHQKLYGLQIYLVSLVVACLNIVIVSIINANVQNFDENQSSYRVLAVYTAICILYFLTQYFYAFKLIKITERIVSKKRRSVVDLARFSQYESYEKLHTSKLMTIVSFDANNLGSFVQLFSQTLTLSVTIVGILVYLLFISTTGFIISSLVIMVSIVISLALQKQNIAKLTTFRKSEDEYYKNVADILSGMKEAKMDSKVHHDLYTNYVLTSAQNVHEKKQKHSWFQAKFSLLGQGIFFFTIGVAVFVLPIFDLKISEDPSQVVIILLYTLPPLQSLIPIIPQLVGVRMSLVRISSLGDEMSSEHQENRGSIGTRSFESLSLENVEYAYGDTGNFSLGPIDIRIKAGELVTIYGGNGSGKSTFLKILTGLYEIKKGTIAINGQQKRTMSLQDYRDHFGVLFTDHYVFQNLYGVNGADPEAIQRLLGEMGLAKKVTVNENRFNTINLSEGQRKRIALISILLKDKPIYVFDEPVANQDLDFKVFFHDVIVKRLIQQGKTVILISHDERFYGRSNRIFKMDLGQLVEVKSDVEDPVR